MILVTGGTGFIGSHVVYRLLKAGSRIRVMSRHTGAEQKLRERMSVYPDCQFLPYDLMEFFQGDIRDFCSVTEAFDGIDMIIHCAGKVSFDRRDFKQMLEVNAGGTAHLVDAAIEKGGIRFCHVSSIAVLDSSETPGNVTEENGYGRPVRSSGYAFSKIMAGLEFRRGIAEGLEGVEVYPSVVLGPGNPLLNIDPLIRWLRGHPRHFPPGATGFTDVRDLASAIVHLAFKGEAGEGYIINGANLRYSELLSLIAGRLDLSSPQKPATKWQLHLLAFLSRTIPFSPVKISSSLSGILCSSEYYGSEKFLNHSGFRYTPPGDTIEWILQHLHTH